LGGSGFFDAPDDHELRKGPQPGPSLAKALQLLPHGWDLVLVLAALKGADYAGDLAQQRGHCSSPPQTALPDSAGLCDRAGPRPSLDNLAARNAQTTK
jgi:hypothetical protein